MPIDLLVDTVDLLTTELINQKNLQKEALIEGTVSEEAVDNFCQAREDNYLEDSFNKFISLGADGSTGDASIIGAQQVNSFLAGFQQAYLQRRRSKLARRVDRQTTNAQNIDENGVLPAQLKNVGVITDSFFITEYFEVGQEPST
jgi:hypothetical protein